MILSKTTEYALSILSYMATRTDEVYSAEYLFNELKIPRSYLRRLLTGLSKFGFIKSSLGRKGGFVFAKDIKEISFYQIINTMEGADAMNTCLLGFSCCIVDHPCVMHDIWMEARSKMINTLSNTTLADLKEKYQQDLLKNLRSI
ncbi:MAG: Rrf2 family transcriptional regulator [Bacteroidia bacterium]|nr:Rrf2 family transcriptional regulator [Bacteroidia bacterium]